MLEDLFTPDDQRLLDRLVDGELSETERAELLRRIERAPDGWRCCGLTFLEAQAWRNEAKSLVNEPAAVGGSGPLYERPAPAAWRRPVFWMPLATAATLIFGWALYVSKFDPSQRDVAGVAAPPNGVVSVVDGAQQASISASSNEPAPGEPQNLRLVVRRGPNGEQQVVEVPLVGIQDMNEALLGQWSQTLSPEMVRMLEQSGNQIVRQRRLVPVDLGDGRRVVVPMDQVEIVPVSNRFQ